MNDLTRRGFGQLSLSAFFLGAAVIRPDLSLAAVPSGTPLHGLSAFGDLKYAPDFTHFDYVNPSAPKGGVLNISVPNWAFNQNPQTFNTLNTFVQKGDAPPRMELCYPALMVRALDEPSAIYGLLAETVSLSEDGNIFTFTLREEAVWDDGSPITAQDVAYSLNTFKSDGHASLLLALGELDDVVATDERTVEFRFSGNQSAQAILTAAVMPIISSEWNEEIGFTNAVMERPMTGGPYKLGNVQVGRSITYERNETWWGNALGVAKGQNNFGTIRIDFFSDRQAAFEAFKKGDITHRQEFTSKVWANDYDFPAVQDGRVIKTGFSSEKVPLMQAWALNTRREKLADPRTREAIGLAFDFEWTNTNIFYGLYARSDSVFQNSHYRATGTPPEAEFAVLEPYRDQLSKEVFGEAPTSPISDGSGSDRSLLRRASQLLAEAGWQRDGRQLVDANGAAFTLEYLIRSPVFERSLSPYIKNLKLLGIDASIRLVDPAQYRARIDGFDFDVTGFARRFGAVPSTEVLAQAFSSGARDVAGSTNLSGIADPVVDALIEQAGKANNIEDFTVTLRALDRVLRLTHTVVHNWYSPNHRVAYWDLFGFPEEKPDYDFPVETTWWWDADKAAAINRA